ncbi:unnamed protein product [Mytilus coruscus]|uniref:Uncharacterized protein n=1 Tax=Mytilus coruscus TaxID=42192 RepID=A0A6J7ZVK1_MYTCO|nr:unnamed protein product [Mytilus coruscus]
MAENIRNSLNDMNESHRPVSNKISSSSVNIVNETCHQKKLENKNLSKSSLNSSQELKQKNNVLSSSQNFVSSDNILPPDPIVTAYRKNLDLMKKGGFYMFIVIMCVCISFSICYVMNWQRNETSESHSELCVFKLDQTKLKSLVNSSKDIPFVDAKCDFLSFNTRGQKFEVQMSGSFELSLSVALRLNNSVGRNALVCIDYNLSNDRKREVCSRAQFPSNDSNSAVINLGLPDGANLSARDEFHVKISNTLNVYIQDSLTRLVVKYFKP